MLKKIIRKIDDLFLGQAIQRHYSNWLASKIIASFMSGFDFKIVSFYNKNADCEISRLCDVYGSDKGEIGIGPHPYPWPSHTYADFYSRLFWHCRDRVRNVFECGLGTNNPELPSSMGTSGQPGASLRVWRDFFPNAMIFGGDIDSDVLFEEHRIKTFYIDQLNPETIKSFWQAVDTIDFDFRIGKQDLIFLI